jgi:hypothetical protein
MINMQSTITAGIGYIAKASHDQDFTASTHCSDSGHENEQSKTVSRCSAFTFKFNQMRSINNTSARSYAGTVLRGSSSWAHGKLVNVGMCAGDNEQHSLTSSVITDRLTCAAHASNK